jgi:AbrB family looped-hinge helix DNA binding protein
MRYATRIGGGGRVVIPVEFRRELRLRPGDEVVLSLEDGEVRLRTRAQGRRRAQDYVCRLVPAKVSLAKELIRERREPGVS